MVSFNLVRAGSNMPEMGGSIAPEGDTERTIDAKGQLLIEPKLTLDGWSTSLSAKQFDAKAIVALYADHGTHEQFHSEFKTDLDLERLPSGKFDTNYLVCELEALAMNILRLMGRAGLLGPDAPVRHAAKRRRIKTVMQELIYRAGRLIEHGPGASSSDWAPMIARPRPSSGCTENSSLPAAERNWPITGLTKLTDP